MSTSKGIKIEERMRKFFKGYKNGLDEVDFETKKCLYEVKSCKLFNNCGNSNHNREYKKAQHKKIYTTQLGQFKISTDNHILLGLQSIAKNKVAKYVFVIQAAGQIIYKIIPWEQIYLPNNKDYHYLNLNKVFKE